VELQALDSEIARLQSLTRQIPVAIEERARDLAETRATVEAMRKKGKDALHKRRALDGELKVAHDKRNHLLNNLHVIKTNREYTAALSEIETSKAQEGALEDAILAQMEVCDRIEHELAETEKRLKGEETRVKEQQEELRAELARVEGQLAERQAERAVTSSGVPADILSRYERIRGGKGGIAVVAVTDGVCGGCFRRLPPQLALEVKLSEEIQSCQFCGRILHPAASAENDASEGTQG
jgi:hypothetical protein